MDAVLDTSVVVSALVSPKGPPAEIMRAWRARSFVWVTSEPLLDELARALRYPRLKRYLAWTDAERKELVALIRRQAKVVSPSQRLGVIEDDPDDNRVLEAAVEGHADYVVTGDRHLLVLGTYAGISIVTPARFAAVLATGLA